MEYESTITANALPLRAGRMTSRRRVADTPLEPAAIDEIFANLACRQERIERTREPKLNPAQLRDTAAEMDRQRERLAQLLRDIDSSASE